jgi:hypothetical protein
MPAHNGLGSDDRNGLKDRRKPAIQQDEEKPITVRELDPPAHLPLQHGQLMPERSILRLKSALRLERRRQPRQKEAQQRDHCGQRYAILSPDQCGRGFRYTQVSMSTVPLTPAGKSAVSSSRGCDRARGRGAFLVVRNPEQRRKLGVIYQSLRYRARHYEARGRPAHMTEQLLRR